MISRGWLRLVASVDRSALPNNTHGSAEPLNARYAASAILLVVR